MKTKRVQEKGSEEGFVAILHLFQHNLMQLQILGETSLRKINPCSYEYVFTIY